MTNTQDYFASANSADGFVSYFGEVFNPKELTRIYIIKGGSGCGKSRLIVDIGHAANRKGLSIERYYCSSDTSSLDGLIIPSLNTAVIDGTSPHAIEAQYPGACETIINLMQFMDKDFLGTHKDEIMRLTDSKTALYKTAYRYLSATDNIQMTINELCNKAYLADKARSSQERLSNDICASLKGIESPNVVQHKYISSISHKGYTRLTTLYSICDNIISISNNYNTGYRYITDLWTLLSERKINAYIFPTPLNRNIIEAIYMPDVKIGIIVEDKSIEHDKIVKHINTDRFTDKHIMKSNRQKLRFAAQCSDIMLENASESLCEAFELHLELEEIYKASMDFAAKEQYAAELTSGIFG